MLEYQFYQTAKEPHSLVFFLHGYNGNLQDHQYAIDWLRTTINNAFIIAPEAPQQCDKNPDKKQWFGMLKYDPERRRSMPETSTDEIFAIYNKAKEDIDRCAANINDFISQIQHKFNIPDSRTYLTGFSQGAMLTIYAALTRSNALAGAFSLSGLVAGSELLADKITAHPPLYLLHGENDLKVQYKTLPNSISWLVHHGIDVQSKSFADLAHKINQEEINYIAKIINQTS